VLLHEKEPAPVRAHGLIDAVAVEKTVVEDGHDRLVLGYKMAIKIDEHGEKVALLRRSVKDEKECIRGCPLSSLGKIAVVLIRFLDLNLSVIADN
jgi:hypothetical protein